MKQIHLCVPQNGFAMQTRAIEIPREIAAYVLTSSVQGHLARAVRHTETVALHRHVAICPRCGKEERKYEKDGAHLYTSTEIIQWVADQQSMLTDTSPDKLEFQKPSLTCEELHCNRCGLLFHQATEFQQVLFQEHKKKLTVSIPIGLSELLRIHRGGYPALQDPEVDWGIFFASYVKTYLECDVRKLSAVQDLNDFRRFMVAVAARTGQMVNYSNIADEIGRDQTTVKAWMSILEASGIVYLLEPYTPSVLKRAIKTPKVYFRDTGLAAYLTRWLTPETLANGAMSGPFFETFVISEILKSYANRGLDYRYSVSYYRGRDKKKVKENGETVEVESEIDLIIEENGTLYPIEIKQSAKVTADEAAAFPVLDKVEEKKRGSARSCAAVPSRECCGRTCSRSPHGIFD